MAVNNKQQMHGQCCLQQQLKTDMDIERATTNNVVHNSNIETDMDMERATTNNVVHK